jgi:hypothetical protein
MNNFLWKIIQPRVRATNVSAERLALLFRIREVPGSNHGPETVYPECFRGFPQSLYADAGIVH